MYTGIFCLQVGGLSGSLLLMGCHVMKTLAVPFSSVKYIFHIMMFILMNFYLEILLILSLRLFRPQLSLISPTIYTNSKIFMSKFHNYLSIHISLIWNSPSKMSKISIKLRPSESNRPSSWQIVRHDQLPHSVQFRVLDRKVWV